MTIDDVKTALLKLGFEQRGTTQPHQLVNRYTGRLLSNKSQGRVRYVRPDRRLRVTLGEDDVRLYRSGPVDQDAPSSTELVGTLRASRVSRDALVAFVEHLLEAEVQS